MSEKPKPLNIFFTLVIIASALFIITIFAMSANILGDENAPMTSIIDRYSGIALGIEFVAILVFGFLAMALDRSEMLREKAKEEESPSADKIETPASKTEE